MDNHNHSPGPWTLSERPCETGCCTVCELSAQYPGDAKPKRHLATIYTDNAVWLRQGEGEANAHLIAAAPELLEALKAMMIGMDPADDDPVADQARAAIAKATGQEQGK